MPFKCVVCKRNNAHSDSCLCISRSCSQKFNRLQNEARDEIMNMFAELRRTYFTRKSGLTKERYNTLNKTPIVKRPATRSIFKQRKSELKSYTTAQIENLGNKVHELLRKAEEHKNDARTDACRCAGTHACSDKDEEHKRDAGTQFCSDAHSEARSMMFAAVLAVMFARTLAPSACVQTKNN